MPTIYCCYHDNEYVSCHNSYTDANYNLQRIIENHARQNLLLAAGMPESICACHNAHMFDQLTRSLGISDAQINAEIEVVRPSFAVVEKTIV